MTLIVWINTAFIFDLVKRDSCITGIVLPKYRENPRLKDAVGQVFNPRLFDSVGHACHPCSLLFISVIL